MFFPVASISATVTFPASAVADSVPVWATCNTTSLPSPPTYVIVAVLAENQPLLANVKVAPSANPSNVPVTPSESSLASKVYSSPLAGL